MAVQDGEREIQASGDSAEGRLERGLPPQSARGEKPAGNHFPGRFVPLVYSNKNVQRAKQEGKILSHTGV